MDFNHQITLQRTNPIIIPIASKALDTAENQNAKKKLGSIQSDQSNKFSGFDAAQTHLNVSRQYNFLDIELMERLISNPGLTSVNLQDCVMLTNRTIKILIETLKHLQELNIGGCKKISDRAINQIIDSQAPLKRLYLDNMKGLRIGTLRKLYLKNIEFTAKGNIFEECLYTLLGHTAGIQCFVQLNDGRLASGSDDTTLKLWNIKNVKNKITLRSHTSAITGLHEINDGQLLSVGFEETYIWNVKGYIASSKIELSANYENSYMQIKEGFLISLSWAYEIKWKSIQIKNHKGKFSGHSKAITSIICLKDGRLASGALDRTIKLWTIPNKNCDFTLQGHTKAVLSLVELSNNRLASGSDDNTIKLWNLKTASCIATLSGHSSFITTLIQLSNEWLASGSNDSTIKLWVV